MKIKEDFINMILGLIIVIVIVGVVINFVKRNKGNVEVPGIVTTSGNEVIVEDKEKYVVKENDCLWKIAVLEYGDGFYWTKIWQANKKNIRDPNKIEIGMTLEITLL